MKGFKGDEAKKYLNEKEISIIESFSICIYLYFCFIILKQGDKKMEVFDNQEVNKMKEKLFNDVNLCHISMKKLCQNGYLKIDNWIIQHLMNKEECKIKNVNQLKMYLFLYKKTAGNFNKGSWKIDINEIKVYTGFTYQRINYIINKLHELNYIIWDKKTKNIYIITDFPVNKNKETNKKYISIPNYLIYALIWKNNGINHLYEMMIVLYCLKMVFGYRKTKNISKKYHDNGGKIQYNFKRQVISDYQKDFYLKDGFKSISEYTNIENQNIHTFKKKLIDNGIISTEIKNNKIIIHFSIDIRKWKEGKFIMNSLQQKNIF